MKVANKRPGRPKGTGILNAKLSSDIAAYVSNGLTYKDAAVMVGISEAALHKWKEKGEKAKSGIYFNFVQQLKKAVVHRKGHHLNLLNKHAAGYMVKEVTKEVMPDGKMVVTKEVEKHIKGDSANSRWLLERWHGDEFGPQITVNGDAPVVDLNVIIEGGKEYQDAYADMVENIMDAPDNS